MRTNIEDDLIASGRLDSFAVSADLLHSALPEQIKQICMALGALVFAYRDSQKRRFTTGTRERLVRALRARFGQVAEVIVDGMLSSELADLTATGRVRVRGNRQQVERLQNFHKIQTEKGKIRAKSATRREDGTFNPADIQPPPASLLPSPSPNTNTARKRASAKDGAALRSKREREPKHVRPGVAETKAKLAAEDEARSKATPPEQALEHIRAIAR